MSHVPSAVTLQPMQFPSEPWEELGIDVVGPFQTAAWDCHFALILIITVSCLK